MTFFYPIFCCDEAECPKVPNLKKKSNPTQSQILKLYPNILKNIDGQQLPDFINSFLSLSVVLLYTYLYHQLKSWSNAKKPEENLICFISIQEDDISQQEQKKTSLVVKCTMLVLLLPIIVFWSLNLSIDRAAVRTYISQYSKRQLRKWIIGWKKSRFYPVIWKTIKANNDTTVIGVLF